MVIAIYLNLKCLIHKFFVCQLQRYEKLSLLLCNGVKHTYFYVFSSC